MKGIYCYLLKYLKYFPTYICISLGRGSWRRIKAKTVGSVCQQVLVVVGGDNFKNKYVCPAPVNILLTGSPPAQCQLNPLVSY